MTDAKNFKEKYSIDMPAPHKNRFLKANEYCQDKKIW